jgi:hypothetical protein
MARLMVDGGFFRSKPLLWFLINTYFFEAFMWWLSCFPFSCLYNQTSYTLEFNQVHRGYLALLFRVLVILLDWIFHSIHHYEILSFSLNALFNIGIFLFQRWVFSYGFFSFSVFVRLYFVLGYLIRPRCRDPIFSYVSSLHFT